VSVIFSVVKVRELIRIIEEDGWFHVRTTGSHHHYKHAAKPGIVTVPGNPNDDVRKGTLNSILKRAGLKEVNG
jgi:predicted RNA binding protein YcfA (HicA-like mRNA interferase family)